MMIVQLFCNASGLKINLSKSQVLRVNIDEREVEHVANILN